MPKEFFGKEHHNWVQTHYLIRKEDPKGFGKKVQTTAVKKVAALPRSATATATLVVAKRLFPLASSERYFFNNCGSDINAPHC